VRDPSGGRRMIFVFRYYEDDHFEWVEMTEEEE
jgi:hypothetical protein